MPGTASPLAWGLATSSRLIAEAGHGVRSVEATGERCKHEAVVNVHSLPDKVYVPDVALRLRCSACGSKNITTRPDWTHHAAHGRGGYTTARNPGS